MLYFGFGLNFLSFLEIGINIFISPYLNIDEHVTMNSQIVVHLSVFLVLSRAPRVCIHFHISGGTLIKSTEAR